MHGALGTRIARGEKQDHAEAIYLVKICENNCQYTHFTLTDEQTQLGWQEN